MAGHAPQWNGERAQLTGGKTVHRGARGGTHLLALAGLLEVQSSITGSRTGEARPAVGATLVQRGTYDARAATRVFRGRPRPCQPFVGISRRSSVGYMGPSNSAAGSYAVGG